MVANPVEYERLGDPDADWQPTVGDKQRQRNLEDSYAGLLRYFKETPPPPLSDRQAQEIAELLRVPTAPTARMRWWVRYFCGHVAEKTAHSSYSRYTDAAGGYQQCPECGRKPVLVVAAKPLGPEAKPDGRNSP